jgi:4-hydroxybenzoate polyprenyltransferase
MTIARLLAPVFELDHLVRFHQLGFVATWPLLGWASVASWSSDSFAGLLATSLFFNTYGVILDDAVHVQADRRDPLRTERWLVRGILTPAQGVAVALAQVPLMLVAHYAAGFPAQALPWLMGAAVGQGVYDVYGKRCRVPPLMEGAEAAAAFMLVLYGASATGADLTRVVWLTAWAGAIFILLVNAFHGSLRDIDVELVSGERTTPIWLGCRGTTPDGIVHISRPMSVYGGALQLCLMGAAVTLALRLARNDGTALAAVFAAVAMNGALFALLHCVAKPAWEIVMRLHVVLLMMPVLLAFAPHLGAWQSAALFTVYFAPTLLTAYWWWSRSIPAPAR